MLAAPLRFLAAVASLLPGARSLRPKAHRILTLLPLLSPTAAAPGDNDKRKATSTPADWDRAKRQKDEKAAHTSNAFYEVQINVNHSASSAIQ